MIVIFDFGLGQGGLLDHRPQHRLGSLVKRSVGEKFTQFADDLRFGGEGHSGVGIIPVAENAKALELFALDVDPFVGEFPAFMAEPDDGYLILVFPRLAVFFLDLPFYRQAVTVPAGNIVGIEAQHLPGPHDYILENLVQGMADMKMAVGVWRPVMEDELLPALGIPAQFPVNFHSLPAIYGFRLSSGQAGFHRERSPGKKQGRFVVHADYFIGWLSRMWRAC